MMKKETPRPLFPPLKPYREGRLRVSKLHDLHFEECGSPKGKPLIFLHGGPGGGTDPVYRRYFDPKKWRIVLFDQRGCGKSTPHAELRENTTWDLVEDIEKLRRHLGIERWVVFGGSWGSTLSLAYSQKHPARCKAIILRGIFLLRKKELDWFYQEGGTSALFPDLWERYVRPIPVRERGDMVRAYHKRLTSKSRKVRLEAAKAWSIWEGATSKLRLDPSLLKRFGQGRFAESFARIECHYFINKGFLRKDTQLLDDVRKIRKIPAVIVQGRYDVICPMMSAWALHKAWPEAEFRVIPDAGHSMTELGTRSALIEAAERFSRL
ncbi:MAG: prolyl aminopeptidase [Elusimicrobiota bacterium]